MSESVIGNETERPSSPPIALRMSSEMTVFATAVPFLRSWSDANADELGFQVLDDALLATLAAEPALLHAAERRRRGGRVDVVDPDDGKPERLADPDGAGQVLGVQVGGQAVAGVVGHLDHLVLVVEQDDRGDRAERLLPVDEHLRGDV